MNKNSKILIVGHQGIIDQSLCEYFKRNDFRNIFCASDIGLETTIQTSVYDFFARHKPEIVILSSVLSGGIAANQEYPADFIYQNLESQNNIIYASFKFGVQKLLNIASSCIYPKQSVQPIREEYFLTGKMEETSEPYSMAKAAGICLCQSFRRQHKLNAVTMVPATIYGPGCDVDLKSAHVLGALMQRFASAVKEGKEKVVLWGSGQPRREFLYKDDFVNACLFLLQKYNSPEIINAGCGYDVSIHELAQVIARLVGFNGRIVYDESKPDGTYQKILDSSRINGMGWKPRVDLKDGIEKTWAFYKDRFLTGK